MTERLHADDIPDESLHGCRDSSGTSVACPQRPPSCPHVAAASANVRRVVAAIVEEDKYLAQPDLDAAGGPCHRCRKWRTRRSPSGQAHGIPTAVVGIPRSCHPGRLLLISDVICTAVICTASCHLRCGVLAGGQLFLTSSLALAAVLPGPGSCEPCQPVVRAAVALLRVSGECRRGG